MVPLSITLNGYKIYRECKTLNFLSKLTITSDLFLFNDSQLYTCTVHEAQKKKRIEIIEHRKAKKAKKRKEITKEEKKRKNGGRKKMKSVAD